MIKKIKFKFGTISSNQPLEFELTPITIFVGPNNSGKSKALVEIQEFCSSNNVRASDVVIAGLEFIQQSLSSVQEDIEKLKKPTGSGAIIPGQYHLHKISPNNNKIQEVHIVESHLFSDIQAYRNLGTYYFNYLSLFIARLDGITRLNLLNEQPAGDLQEMPKNHLMKLFQDDTLRGEVRRIIFSAFEKYFVLDPTNIGKLRVKLSDRQPADEAEEKNWDSRAVQYHKENLSIESASDGVKAFIGIITTILAGDPRVLLIDEPEAFLHPSLAYKLGIEVALAMNKPIKRFIASTHSSNFLMGCIQSGVHVNIVRLTYKNSSPTVRLLSKEKILHLMRNPLLRSVGVLNGLFYDSVIVTEGDTDRAFYQEINERLLKVGDVRGIPNCLFLNAQNKQTVWDIVKPLRELGIPTVAIVDIDVLKDGGGVFTKTLNSTFIPPITHNALQQQRHAFHSALQETGQDMKRHGGINLLNSADREGCVSFLDALSEYGYFVLRNGEIESWLNSLGITGHGPSWLIPMFERMGENPEASDYIRPGIGDVWDFIGEIKTWIDNPNKKGIPE